MTQLFVPSLNYVTKHITLILVALVHNTFRYFVYFLKILIFGPPHCAKGQKLLKITLSVCPKPLSLQPSIT